VHKFGIPVAPPELPPATSIQRVEGKP
jgi:hypothetical protein